MQAIFPGFIGHDRQQKLFTRLLERKKLGHAYLLVGPTSSGRTTFAKHLLRTIFPEGNLETHPDIFTLERLFDKKTGKQKRNISVSQVREVRSQLHMSPSQFGGYKAVWIEEAHTMSIGASNALLKILEEPRGKTIFFLRAPSLVRVLPTISSRMHCISFSPLTEKKLSESLQSLYPSDERIREAVKIAQGCPGRALRFLAEDEDILAEYVRSQSIGILTERNVRQAMQLVSGLFQDKKTDKFNHALNEISIWERLAYNEFHEVLKNIHTSEKKMQQAKIIEKFLWSLSDAKKALLHNVQPQAVLEQVFISSNSQ